MPISRRHDVRLTMGGEPTFVSIDDYQSPEWTVAALGADKRVLADALTRRLRARFAPRRPAALRARQMVSGRSDAALGLRALLAARRQADVARRRADRARRRNERADGGGCAALRRGDRAGARHRGRRACSRPTRTRLHWMAEEARASGRMSTCAIQNCSMPRRAPAWCAPSSAGSGRRPATCCRCAATASVWASEAWELRREQLFLLPGDLPVGSRLPLAALPRVEPATIRSSRSRTRWPTRRPCPIRSRAETGRGRDRAHRARGRAARRQAQRVHAVRRHARGLSRCPRRRRGGGRRAASCRCISRATRRRSTRGSRSSR